MNFVRGTLADRGIDTVLGQIPLTDDLRRGIQAADVARDVLVGIRPEHLEDAALPAVADHRFCFDVDVDAVESIGSDVFAYFAVPDTGIPGASMVGGGRARGGRVAPAADGCSGLDT